MKRVSLQKPDSNYSVDILSVMRQFFNEMNQLTREENRSTVKAYH